MSHQALLSRGVDPLLGVFTGCLAYYLYEPNPRTALPPDQRLGALLQWKWAKQEREREGGKHVEKRKDLSFESRGAKGAE